MLICSKINELERFLSERRSKGDKIGFVPTMGALHQGHLSLISNSKTSCNLTVCSIFVNPNQFNDKDDLQKYPRTPSEDINLLKSADCDVVFMPTVEEIYPHQEITHFDFGYLDKVLEGQHRPGHFNGVAQVVKRLFEIVKPNKAFFGGKDFQQVMIVKALVKKLALDVEIVPCAILREKDGLAMSSRNTLLSIQERQLAVNIPIWLQDAKKIIKTSQLTEAKKFISHEISKHPSMRLDYFEVCELDSLEILNDDTEFNSRIALIALFVGKIRLIDNINID